MVWPELQKAKKNALNISNEVERMLKEHNSLSKKEITKHSDELAQDVSEALITLENEIKELVSNIKSHKKQLESKGRFLRRHHSRHIY